MSGPLFGAGALRASPPPREPGTLSGRVFVRICLLAARLPFPDESLALVGPTSRPAAADIPEAGESDSLLIHL